MRSAALKLIVLCLSLVAVTTTYAQSGDAPAGTSAQLDAPMIEPLPPLVDQFETGFSSYQAQPESVTPPAAAPPPDPPLPKWGDYSRPQPAPVLFPQRLYDLIGPPRGVVQPSFGQAYQRIIGDPSSVPAIDASLTLGIDLARPDGIAPVGVQGDNTLRAGRLLFSARYGQGSFDQNFVSSHTVSTASILANYPYAPRRLFQQTETAILEYGTTDDFTIMFTVPWQQSRLDYLDAGGGSSSASFGNPGDVKVSGLYVLYREPGQQVHLNLGVSVPTGFLDYQNDKPLPTFPNLPYVIRTSSGTYDLLPGVTYRGQNESSTWGVQVMGVVRLGLNNTGYELGNRVDLTAWYSRRWTRRWATSARIDGQDWGNVRQADPRLNTSLSPVNQPGMQGGSRINLLFGINYFWPQDRIPGQIFSIEAGAPVFQSLDGPQLGLNWTLIAGWNLFF